MRIYPLYIQLDDLVVAQLEAADGRPIDEILGAHLAISLQALIASVVPPLVQEALAQTPPVRH